MKVHISLIIIVPLITLVIGIVGTWKFRNYLDEDETFDGKTTDRQLINQDKKLSNIESE